jgi:hypothetical protein
MSAEIVKQDQTGRYFLRVKLRSAAAPKNWSQTLVPFGRGFKRRLEYAAASLAEHQCLHFGDRHDPSEVSRAMVRLASASMAQALEPRHR